MTSKFKSISLISLCLTGVVMMSSCMVSDRNTSEVTDGTPISAVSAVVETSKEAMETAAVAKPTQIAAVTPTPTVKETTADMTEATERAVTEATTKAPVATTVVTAAAATAAPSVETTPPETIAPAYAENCDNIKILVIEQLQAKGLWYPDAEVNGGGSILLSVGYANADDQYATAFVNGKFGTPDGTGATSVSVWIESGYLNMSYTKCTLPVA